MHQQTWRCTKCGENNPPYTEICLQCMSDASSSGEIVFTKSDRQPSGPGPFFKMPETSPVNQPFSKCDGFIIMVVLVCSVLLFFITSVDVMFFWLIMALACVHLYFGVRYRDYFLVGKENINETYWEMIEKFKEHHPKPAQFLTSAIRVQIVVMIAFGAYRLFK